MNEDLVEDLIQADGYVIKIPRDVGPRAINEVDELTRSAVCACILQLRVMGVKYDRLTRLVNEKFNTKMSQSTAHDIYKRQLKQMPKEALQESRELALLRASEVMQIAHARAKKGSAKHLEVYLAANKQVIEMLGLDAPQEIVINANERAEAVRQRLIERAAELTASGDDRVVN
jgi:hypothetical protein